MAPAVERIRRAIQEDRRITVFGDYDADGVTAAALLVRVFGRLGARVLAFLPNRLTDGYGLSVPALSRCVAEQRPDLVVTVDCGTGSVVAVRWARERGLDVVITDHHEVSGETAPAAAVVNPKLGGDAATQPLAGVGVAFKLCHALLKHDRDRNGAAAPGLDLRDWLDLVAVGTVADVVPLVGENRILVRHGLARLNAAPCVGLQALLAAAGLAGRAGSHHLGFVIGPRLNAAGRLGSAETALRLLLADDAADAARLAAELEAANDERKRIEDGILREALAEIEGGFDARRDCGIVAGRDGWHVGTIGIVAARLCARFRRPAAVVAFGPDGVGRGSCRSMESVDLLRVLRGCADLLRGFGGHKLAAGLELERRQFDAFRQRFNEGCAAIIGGADLSPVQRVDAWIDLREADEALLAAIRQFEPLGEGNPTPTWGARDIRVVGTPRAVGREGAHLRLTLAHGATQMNAMAFNRTDRDVTQGALDILFRLEENVYLGQRTLRLNLQDFAPAE
jgi:single-stranded-DNA-specific exonuclease